MPRRDAPPRLTDRFIASVKIDVRTSFADHGPRSQGGLSLRVTPNGTKTWALSYRTPTGIQRMLTLGKYPEMGLADARNAAISNKMLIAGNRDPAAEAKQLKAIERFDELADRYIDRHAKAKKRSWKRDEHILKREVRPKLGGKRIDLITRRDVLDVVEEVEGRGAAVQAQRVFEIVRGLFRWAVANDYTSHDPTFGIKRRVARETRSRYLSEAEIRSFWLGLDSAEMAEITRRALRLALITGQRIGEVCAIELAELRLNQMLWIIPAAKAKNGREHHVPLSSLALATIEEALGSAGKSAFLFPSAPRKRIGKKPVQQPLAGAAAAKAMARNLKQLGLDHDPATPHDLRRSMGSHMARLGFPEHVIGRMMNHRSDVARTITSAVYIRHGFDAEMRMAVDTWATEIERIISGLSAPSNVVPLAQRVQQ